MYIVGIDIANSHIGFLSLMDAVRKLDALIKRKIIALLDQTFPEYEKLFSDTFGKSSVELLAKMLSVDTQTLADLLNKASCGRFGLDKANQIQQTAKNSFGIVLASSRRAFDCHRACLS